jgi:fructose-1,6-bisphosphatase class II
MFVEDTRPSERPAAGRRLWRAAVHSKGRNGYKGVDALLQRNHHLDFLRVTEAAALSAARWVGKGDRNQADQAACDGMRRTLNELDMCGTIVIGEGERDEAPMLYIGEKVGVGDGPLIQIAVDPLEGTNLCANGLPNAIAVMAAAVEGEGKLLAAPDCYMDKLVVPAECKGVVDITLPPRVNVRLIAKARGKDVDELIIGVLDRPRHQELIQEIREAGARVHLVSDGDLSVALAVLDPDGPVDAAMGIGGAPEGVITAAAVICMGGEMQAKLVFRSDSERVRAVEMNGEAIVDRVMKTEDLAQGSVMFAATGITGGDLLKGVRYRRGYALTDSLIMRSATGTIRRIETVHQDVASYDF